MNKGKKTTAFLTKHLRLVVYSYLDTSTIMSHIMLLSKCTSNDLINSYIIRQGKCFSLEISDDDFFKRSAPTNNSVNPTAEISLLSKKVKRAINLVENLHLKIVPCGVLVHSR